MTDKNNSTTKKHVRKVSIVMPAYNAERYIGEAIDSIIRQSFTDFECIIVDDGSTDNTRDIIRSYADERIVLIENQHDYIGSLNIGIDRAEGKYIARMDADDIMHPDRLKVQYTIMETEPSITVCSSWMHHFGANVSAGSIAGSYNGLVEFPLLAFLQGNFVFHSTTMIRKSFLRKHQLEYESYPYAEDLKLWTEIAKREGLFYVESQPLMNFRISETEIFNQKREEGKAAAERILFKTIGWLLDRNKENQPELKGAFESLIRLQEKELISFSETMKIIRKIFITNKNKLQLA